jgi:hypothetical protein
MTFKLSYIAAPYMDPDPMVMYDRFTRITAVAARYMMNHEFVFSPITHIHPILLAANGGLGNEWEYWSEYARTMIRQCDRMIVLQLPGWDSPGTMAEIQIAEQIGIAIEYITE